MKRQSKLAAICLTFLCVLQAQALNMPANEIRIFELGTVVDHSTEPPSSRYRQNVGCIDLVKLAAKCGTAIGLVYGERFGERWDILQVVGSQTRMIKVGSYQLNDAFDIPQIEPWAKLQPGEQRSLYFDGSGSDGEHGLNADGTKQDLPPVRVGGADKPFNDQVSSKITRADGTVVDDDYKPWFEIEQGYVYAVRVFDEKNDQYLLLRIDELDRGERVVISVKRVDGPSR